MLLTPVASTMSLTIAPCVGEEVNHLGVTEIDCVGEGSSTGDGEAGDLEIGTGWIREWTMPASP